MWDRGDTRMMIRTNTDLCSPLRPMITCHREVSVPEISSIRWLCFINVWSFVLNHDNPKMLIQQQDSLCQLDHSQSFNWKIYDHITRHIYQHSKLLFCENIILSLNIAWLWDSGWLCSCFIDTMIDDWWGDTLLSINIIVSSSRPGSIVSGQWSQITLANTRLSFQVPGHNFTKNLSININAVMCPKTKPPLNHPPLSIEMLAIEGDIVDRLLRMRNGELTLEKFILFTLHNTCCSCSKWGVSTCFIIMTTLEFNEILLYLNRFLWSQINQITSSRQWQCGDNVCSASLCFLTQWSGALVDAGSCDACDRLDHLHYYAAKLP